MTVENSLAMMSTQRVFVVLAFKYFAESSRPPLAQAAVAHGQVW
jgi:hypothetical protein